MAIHSTQLCPIFPKLPSRKFPVTDWQQPKGILPTQTQISSFSQVNLKKWNHSMTFPILGKVDYRKASVIGALAMTALYSTIYYACFHSSSVPSHPAVQSSVTLSNLTTTNQKMSTSNQFVRVLEKLVESFNGNASSSQELFFGSLVLPSLNAPLQCAALPQKKQELEQKKQELERKKQELEQEKQELERKKQELEQEIPKLKQKEQELEQEIPKLKQKEQELEQEIPKLKQKEQKLKQEIEALPQKKQELEQQIMELRVIAILLASFILVCSSLLVLCLFQRERIENYWMHLSN